jgi:hypothetical protein
LQGMRRVSCQVRVWNVEGRGSAMKGRSLGMQTRICRAGLAGIETISPDSNKGLARSKGEATGDRPQRSSLQPWKANKLCFEKFSTFIWSVLGEAG